MSVPLSQSGLNSLLHTVIKLYFLVPVRLLFNSIKYRAPFNEAVDLLVWKYLKVYESDKLIYYKPVTIKLTTMDHQFTYSRMNHEFKILWLFLFLGKMLYKFSQAFGDLMIWKNAQLHNSRFLVGQEKFPFFSKCILTRSV